MLIFYHFDGKKTYWSKEKPDHVKLIGKVKWRDEKGLIVLCCDESVYNDNTVDEPFKPDLPHRFTTKDLSILRSNLQKCARRELKELGMKTAVSMVSIVDDSGKQKGLFEMLRRITVINIEDSVLIKEYGLLVWFMCFVSKGVTVNGSLMNMILRITSKVYNTPFKDHAYKHTSHPKPDLNKVRSQDLLISLLFRNSFKGMICDQKMINQSISIWLGRFRDNSVYLKYLDVPSLVDEKQYKIGLKPDEILFESYDHHCTDVVNMIRSYLPINVDKQRIESMLWNKSSGFTSRIDIDMDFGESYNPKSEDKLWPLIEPIFKMCAKKLKLN